MAAADNNDQSGLSPVEGPEQVRLKVAGLFAGIGGIEAGMHDAGHETILLCELDDAARHVLELKFPTVPTFIADVHDVPDLAGADLVAAGFPCQDLSQAGRTAGISGEQSGLVGQVFRLLKDEETAPTWLLLENVPFMLQLDRGRAMHYLTEQLGRLGYRWAYRVVDALAFGLPQRRQRVIMLASREEDPRPVLFEEDAGPAEQPLRPDSVCGFYWTEGLRGLGWAVDAVPTLKGGSGIGIPSPPAMWRRGLHIPLHTPDIRDAERLQGFPADWTAAATDNGHRGHGVRWKLVGNAVSVPVAQWVGERLGCNRGSWDEGDLGHEPVVGRWPGAAWGEKDQAYAVPVSTWPRREPFVRLGDFLEHETKPLSHKAAAGFYARTKRAKLRFMPEFIEAVREHLAIVPA
jgi:DNA (cytosine-5)-methyltransferase 1